MLALCLTLIDNENDKNLFKEIYYAHREEMVKIAIKYLRNESDVEDVVHEAFVNVAKCGMETIATIESQKGVRNYLLKITKNVAMQWNEKSRKGYIPMSEDMVVGTLMEGRYEGLEEDTQIQWDYEKAVEAIGKLPEIYNVALYYHYVDEMTVPEIAKLLGEKKETVKKRISRGMALLRKSLEDGGYEV